MSSIDKSEFIVNEDGSVEIVDIFDDEAEPVEDDESERASRPRSSRPSAQRV